MPTINATHRKRLARAYAEQTGLSYMSALDAVTKAAVAGRLPARLDEAGMRAALRILVTGTGSDLPLVPDPITGVVAGAKVATDRKDQPIYNLSFIYEQATGKQGLMYIESSGGRGESDRYVFGGHKVCLGRNEALAHVTMIAAQARDAAALRAVEVEEGSATEECPHAHPEYRSQDGTYCADCNEALMSFEQLKAADKFYLTRSSLNLLRQVWQGRVAWERYGVTKPSFRFTLDSEPAPAGKDIELRWLRDNDYIATPRLDEDDEWVVAKTTPFGDDVLMVNGADVGRFKDGLPTVPVNEPRRVRAGSATTRTETVAGKETPPRSGAVFVAHEGNRRPRCTTTSWRGGGGQKAGEGYGPGGFNRCVQEEGHAGERHVDEWGNVFVTEPKFRKIRTLPQDEVVAIAVEAGMTVGHDR